ncbi:MAG: hypothetical protein V1782_12140 [Pseudomonadota bacterium]
MKLIHCWLNPKLEVRNDKSGQTGIFAQDEKITFDHAMCLHASRWRQTPYRRQCHCGAKTCLGFVTEDDCRNPELRHRYKGYLSGYLQKKIEKKE